MKATAAIRIERQIAQAPGRPVVTVLEVVCPRCLQPVAAVRTTIHGEPFRRHKRRLPSGSKCTHGLTERDLPSTRVAF
jgi:hypothetical protein